MHYFKRNIGDYHKKAGRLSMLEHGAYTLLMDACYDRERFPTEQEAIDWAWARSDEEILAVTFVLSRFFEKVDEIFIHRDIEKDIKKYRENSAINSRIATERENKRRERARSVHETAKKEHEAPPNHKPLTKNQEPLTNKKDNNLLSEKKFSDNDMAIAIRFHESLVAENPTQKKPNFKAWAASIRMMREIDKRTTEQIEWLWSWCRRDSFWYKNIRAPDKLRKKFDDLVIQAKQERRNARRPEQPVFDNESIDWAKDLIEDYGGGCSASERPVLAIASDIPSVDECVWQGPQVTHGSEEAVDARIYGAGNKLTGND